MKQTLSNNEKLAREIGGLNENVTYHNVSNDDVMEKVISKEQAAKLEQQSIDYAKKFDEYADQLSRTANDLSKHPDLQIKPLGNYILAQPFKVNPFQKITTTASGLIIDTGGMVPEYKNNDNGQWEEEEKYIFQGTVVEVGPEVKWLKPNDIVMWCKPSEVPIPFYKLGLVQVSEQRILCVINDDLNTRF